MGKFSKTLEKARQGSSTELNQDLWLEKDSSQEQASLFSTTKVADNGFSHESPIGRWDERIIAAVNEDISIPEIFKVLRSKILHLCETNNVKTVMVTSAIPKEGKSFITANLGISLAQNMDKHALLVDCDLRRPSLGNLLGLTNSLGLVDYLRGDRKLPELIIKTATEKLSIVPSGKPPLNPSELLSSSRMKNLIKELAERYDDRLIVFDTPPVMVAAETAVLSKLIDTTVLVIREAKSPKNDIQKTVDTIGKDNILGVIYNAQSNNILSPSYKRDYEYYRHE